MAEADLSPLLTGGDEDERAVRCGPCSVGTFNTLWLSFCFLGLFSAFQPVQSLQTSSQGSVGFIGLGVLYGSLAIATLLSAAIVRTVGQKWGLVLGSSTYFLYIGVLLLRQLRPDVSVALYYVASAILGFGAAVLWTSQGSLLTIMSSPATLGLFNGIFWGIFMCSYFVGGLITQFVPKGNSTAVVGGNATALTSLVAAAAGTDDSSSSATALFIVFTVLAGVSVLALTGIRVTPSMRKAPGERLNIFESVQMFRDRRMLLLTPSIAYSGLSAAFIFALFPAHIGTAWIGYGLIVYGSAEAIGSFSGGRISDSIGRTPVFLFACASTGIGVLLGALSPPLLLENPSWMYFVAFFCLGLGDSGFNTQVQAAVGHYHPTRTQAAFAFYRGMLSVFAAAGSIAGKWLTPDNFSGSWYILLPSIVLWGVLATSIAAWLVLDRCVEPVWVKGGRKAVN